VVGVALNSFLCVWRWCERTRKKEDLIAISSIQAMTSSLALLLLTHHALVADALHIGVLQAGISPVHSNLARIAVQPVQSSSVRRSRSPILGLTEDLAPLLMLPPLFFAIQKAADLGADQIGGVDLEPKSPEEAAANPPKPLTSFLPTIPTPGSRYAKDIFAAQPGEELVYVGFEIEKESPVPEVVDAPRAPAASSA
jgi:hypothetical protein